MSEYWKSTPKYWCKHCKTHVRDTPLEKNNHEATPRHQGNLNRFLRDLHRTNEREERDAQRAKNEAARLNGSGKDVAPSSAGVTGGGGGGGASGGSVASNAKATPEERKRQLAQLAAMGVAVPDEYRRENAMAGEWESAPTQRKMPLPPRRVLGDRAGREVKHEEVKQEDESPSGEARVTEQGQEEGSRKRSAEDEDAGVGFSFKGKKKVNWGMDTKKFKAAGDDELDALLSSTTVVKKATNEAAETPEVNQISGSAPEKEVPALKQEGSLDQDIAAVPEAGASSTAVTAGDDAGNDEDADLGSMFKKRKTKSTRQK